MRIRYSSDQMDYITVMAGNIHDREVEKKKEAARTVDKVVYDCCRGKAVEVAAAVRGNLKIEMPPGNKIDPRDFSTYAWDLSDESGTKFECKSLYQQDLNMDARLRRQLSETRADLIVVGLVGFDEGDFWVTLNYLIDARNFAQYVAESTTFGRFYFQHRKAKIEGHCATAPHIR